jgi:prepilin-type N-terminal cleavage/methylation domain-containing protein
MRNILKAFLMRWQRKGSQRGFTLAELMIAMAVSALLIVGSAQILHHIVVVSAEDRAQANAILQVQYVGFWISEDVMQAKPDRNSGVHLGSAQGFPLTIQWTEWDGDVNQVIYSVAGTKIWTLSREHLLKPNGETAFTSYGATLIGEYLDTAGTRCYWSETAADVMVLEVASNVDGKVANRTYEINPRSK